MFLNDVAPQAREDAITISSAPTHSEAQVTIVVRRNRRPYSRGRSYETHKENGKCARPSSVVGPDSTLRVSGSLVSV